MRYFGFVFMRLLVQKLPNYAKHVLSHLQRLFCSHLLTHFDWQCHQQPEDSPDYLSLLEQESDISRGTDTETVS